MWQMDNYDLMKTCIFLQCAEIEVSEVYVSSVLESTKNICINTSYWSVFNDFCVNIITKFLYLNLKFNSIGKLIMYMYHYIILIA